MTDIRTASLEDLDAISSSLAAAFHDDPFVAYLLGGHHDWRRSRLAFRMLARNMLQRGIVLTSSDRSAAALWAPPGQWRLGLGAMLRTLPVTLRAYRWHILRALIALVRLERRHPRTPHYFLQVLGTDPSYQGRGIGSRLLGHALRMADRDRIGAYLASSKETNLPFYRRFGFEVIGEFRHHNGPRMWLMWRDPLETELRYPVSDEDGRLRSLRVT